MKEEFNNEAHIKREKIEKLLLPQEVSEILKINIQTLYRMCKNLQIPCIRIGRGIRFHRDVLDQWIRARP